MKNVKKVRKYLIDLLDTSYFKNKDVIRQVDLILKVLDEEGVDLSDPERPLIEPLGMQGTQQDQLNALFDQQRFHKNRIQELEAKFKDLESNAETWLEIISRRIRSNYQAEMEGLKNTVMVNHKQCLDNLIERISNLELEHGRMDDH